MAISVTNSLTLRNYYGVDRQYVKTSVRSDTNPGKLSFADSTALRNAIKALKNVDYDEIDNDEMKKIMTAFQDTYNLTLASGEKYASSSRDVKNALKRIKNLSKEYENQLGNLGISFDSKGNMQLSDSAISNISNSKYKEMFGEDSDYSKRLNALAKRISSHVDITL